MTAKFAELFQPCRLGSMTVPNRIAMAPMETNQCDRFGVVTQRLIDYYEARAAGGVGLIIVEAACVELQRGRLAPGQIGIEDDTAIAGLSRLAAAIKRHGARAALQIHHGGRNAWGVPDAMGPSAVQLYPGGSVPREMSRPEIEDFVGKFAAAARRAQAAGFDGIEIHAAHQYLIAQFLSAATNRREDDYGGDLAGRARFLLEIIRASRRETGKDFPIWSRISAREFGLERGVTMEESLQVSRWAEAAGADAISVSCYGTGGQATVNMPHKSGAIAWMAAEVKEVVHVPVMAVGRLAPAPAVRLIREGKTDFVAIGRALLADPEWAVKVREGRVDDIRPCISCWECMTIIAGTRSVPIHCTTNPALVREREFAIDRATKPRSVVVVGGGPAGLEASSVAAQRGHTVTLYERASELGGQLLLAGVAPQQGHVRGLRSYLVRQAKKAGVTVVLGKELSVEELLPAQPDAVVVATGCAPARLQLDGIERKPVLTALDVIEGKASAGQRVVVVGGERVGCQAAEILAGQGRQVTLMRRGPRLATKLNTYGSRLLRDRIAAAGVRILTGVQYVRVTDDGLEVLTKEGRGEIVPCDTIVSAIGAVPNDHLFQALRGWAEVYPVGDMVGPKTIWEALSEGWRAGMKV